MFISTWSGWYWLINTNCRYVKSVDFWTEQSNRKSSCVRDLSPVLARPPNQPASTDVCVHAAMTWTHTLQRPGHAAVCHPERGRRGRGCCAATQALHPSLHTSFFNPFSSDFILLSFISLLVSLSPSYPSFYPSFLIVFLSCILCSFFFSPIPSLSPNLLPSFIPLSIHCLPGCPFFSSPFIFSLSISVSPSLLHPFSPPPRLASVNLFSSPLPPPCFHPFFFHNL